MISISIGAKLSSILFPFARVITIFTLITNQLVGMLPSCSTSHAIFKKKILVSTKFSGEGTF